MTLEQRISRLERSCRNWRMGCLVAAGGLALLGAAPKSPAPDAEFANLTASHLTIRNPAGGPQFSVLADGKQTSLQITSDLQSSAIMVVDQNGANFFLTHSAAKGMTEANLGVDATSGSVGLQDATGKSKELEP